MSLFGTVQDGRSTPDPDRPDMNGLHQTRQKRDFLRSRGTGGSYLGLGLHGEVYKVPPVRTLGVGRGGTGLPRRRRRVRVESVIFLRTPTSWCSTLRGVPDEEPLRREINISFRDGLPALHGSSPILVTVDGTVKQFIHTFNDRVVSRHSTTLLSR